MKRASQSLGRLHLSSCYFLKRSNIDISQNMKFFWDACSAVGAIRIDAWFVRYPAQNTWYIVSLVMIGLTSWPGISDNRRTFLS